MLSENGKKYLMILAVILGVYLFMKYISPVVSPFIIAFFLAGFLSRLAGKLPMKVKKPFLAGTMLLLFVILIFILIGSVFVGIWNKGGELAGQLTILQNDMYLLLGDCCDRLEQSFGVDGEAIEDYVLQQINLFAENMDVNIFPVVMNKSVGYMKNIVGVAAYLGITVVAVFLLLKDYEKIVRWMMGNEDLDGIWEIADKVIQYIKTHIKAQGTILLIISILCAGVLSLLGLKGSILYGILTGIMDLLPFIGTGIVLIPLALFQLLKANYIHAAIIFLLYGGCALIREFLEPKLIGNKVGIWPVGILFAVFVGIQLFGVFGIIKGPIGFVIICETCRYLFEKKEP